MNSISHPMGNCERPKLLSKKVLCAGLLLGFFLSLGGLPCAYSEDQLSEVFVDVAERLRPSIVKLSVKSPAEEFSGFEKELAYWLGTERLRILKHWWRESVLKEPLQNNQFTYKTGTAIVVKEKGILITNEHLINDAQEILATLFDGRRYPTELVAVDEWMDLAVLKIPADDLKVPVFGDSSKVKVGQRALVFGNALGYPHTVSQGIISGRERYVHDQFGRVFENVFQTDAAMNFGDSGGALVNTEGEVIGINLAVVPQGENVSFALPTSEFLPILNQLVKKGKMERGWIGLEVAEKKDKVGNQLLVEAMHWNSPSSGVGFSKGDVIVDINGFQPESAYEFYHYIREQKVGDVLSIHIHRQTDVLMKQVSVAAFPSLESYMRYVRKSEPLTGFLDSVPPETRWLILTAVAFCAWLTLRFYRKLAPACVTMPERRYGERRKGERRKGERRKTALPSFSFMVARSRSERRQEKRREAKRRLSMDRRQEGKKAN